MTEATPVSELDLVVVMPVYNEAECIAGVITSWLDVLAREELRFRMIVLNDGSTDATEKVLAPFVADDRVVIITKVNSGHGATILTGYRRAVDLAAWVFQVDSDDEIAATEFSSLWRARTGRDAVFGVRSSRDPGAARWIITRVSRMLVRMLYGRGVSDVNVPFRLMRAGVLASFLDRIPSDTFAPNIVIAGVLARSGFAIVNIPVKYQGRKTGQASIVRLTLWKAAVRAAFQTIRCRRTTASAIESSAVSRATQEED